MVLDLVFIRGLVKQQARPRGRLMVVSQTWNPTSALKLQPANSMTCASQYFLDPVPKEASPNPVCHVLWNPKSAGPREHFNFACKRQKDLAQTPSAGVLLAIPTQLRIGRSYRPFRPSVTKNPDRCVPCSCKAAALHRFPKPSLA